MARDHVPRNDAEFDKHFRFINRYVDEKSGNSQQAWNHIPEEARDVLKDAYASWYAAYIKMTGPHTPVETRAKTETRKEAERKLRAFVRQYLRFPPVTNEDRDAMGINNYSEGKSNIPSPPTRPEFTVNAKDIRRLKLDFWNQDSDSKAKPYGCDAAAICWAVRDTPPVRVNDLTNWRIATRTPCILDFDDTERGKTVYIALCWLNGKGQHGTWSEIRSAIIP
jgi:hypothetical protein